MVSSSGKYVLGSTSFELSVSLILALTDMPLSESFSCSVYLTQSLESRNTYACRTLRTKIRNFPADLKHMKPAHGKTRSRKCGNLITREEGQTSCQFAFHKHCSRSWNSPVEKHSYSTWGHEETKSGQSLQQWHERCAHKQPMPLPLPSWNHLMWLVEVPFPVRHEFLHAEHIWLADIHQIKEITAWLSQRAS